MSNSDSPPGGTLSGRGSMAVLAMFILALTAAAFAWYINFHRGRRTLEFFGPEAAQLIRTAPKVELLRDQEAVIDISKARGLLNARTSLLNDASYDWSKKTINEPQDAVRFSRDEQSVTIFFDFGHGSLQISPGNQIIKLSRKTSDGWRDYVNRHVNAK
jgi:hypothetical protein